MAHKRSRLGEIKRNPSLTARAQRKNWAATKRLRLHTELTRSFEGGYQATVCVLPPKKGGYPQRSAGNWSARRLAGMRKRCGTATNITPTRALKGALTQLAKKLK